MSTYLEALFTSAARVEILRLFLLNPDREYYQREIERETGQPIRAVQREVTRLSEIELLHRSEQGNRVFYRLNRGFPVLPELAALFEREAGVERAARVAEQLPEAAESEVPFPWMEPVVGERLPASLRALQMDGEWDRAY